MTKEEFAKEMHEFAKGRFDWTEEGDDCFVFGCENDYVAIERVDDETFAVECENGYTKNHFCIEGAEEDALSLIAAICEPRIDLCLD